MNYLAIIPASLVALAGGAWAATVAPVSYDELNGFAGQYNYFDDLYTGSGCKTCAGSSLTGGLGDLTNGVIATSNWNVAETSGHGPYVGWAYTDPTITFHFGQLVQIDSVTFSFDDAQAGGVSAPTSVLIGTKSFSVANPVGTAPFSFTASGLGFAGSDLAVKIVRGDVAVFVSEISFLSPVDDAGTGPMAIAGLALVLWIAGRRSRRLSLTGDLA